MNLIWFLAGLLAGFALMGWLIYASHLAFGDDDASLGENDRRE